MKKQGDFGTTEPMTKEQGFKQLTGKELTERIADKTIKGSYFNGRIYAGYIYKDGTIEGKNDLGSFVTGKWFVNSIEKTFSVEWDGYWDNWTGRAYEVNDEIKFYDTTTLNWRTTFNNFEKRKTNIKSMNLRFSKKHEQLISTIIMSLGMGLFLSALFTLIKTGFNIDFFTQWIKSFILALIIALPASFIFKALALKIANKFQKKHKQLITGLTILFGMTSSISFVFTILFTGFNDGLLLRWVSSFALAVAVALPTALILIPIVSKLTIMLIDKESD